MTSMPRATILHREGRWRFEDDAGLPPWPLQDATGRPSRSMAAFRRSSPAVPLSDRELNIRSVPMRWTPWSRRRRQRQGHHGGRIPSVWLTPGWEGGAREYEAVTHRATWQPPTSTPVRAGPAEVCGGRRLRRPSPRPTAGELPARSGTAPGRASIRPPMRPRPTHCASARQVG